MTPMRILALTAFAGVLAACGSEPDQAAETQTAAAPEAQDASPETAPDAVVKDDAALHALLIANDDDLVPSVWSTGEPAPNTALAYWVVPAIDVEAERSATCTPLAEPDGALECTLSFTSAPEDESEERPVTARYRFRVEETGEGDFTLLSPAVRWAVQG